MTKHQQWHVAGCLALPLGLIAIPIILLINVAHRLFGLKISEDLTAADVASYLDDFLNGRDGDWDWDDFTSIPITDRMLDEIRREAANVDLPLDEAGRATLEELLARARELKPA